MKNTIIIDILDNNTSLLKSLYSFVRFKAYFFTILIVSVWMMNMMSIYAQDIKRIDGSIISKSSLEERISLIMQRAKVQGLALAVFNNNKVVYKQAFGTKNTATGAPLKTATNIYGASLSKTIFAVLVLKLVEEGLLELDKPLQSYLDKPIYEYAPQKKWQDNYNDLREDTLYQKITARMCLNHTSGFPNWRWDNQDGKLKVQSIPGSRYSYSGEGMVYLQTVMGFNITIIFPATGTGIIIMTNCDNGESIFKELLQTAIADIYTPWKWQNYIPYDQQ